MTPLGVASKPQIPPKNFVQNGQTTPVVLYKMVKTPHGRLTPRIVLRLPVNVHMFRATWFGGVSGPDNRTKDTSPMDPSAFGQFVPLILIFAIMYFLLIRPQQKKVKEHQAMVEALRRGDQVVTQGGLIGKVSKVKDEGEVEVEIAEGVKVRVVKSTIAQVLSKTEPAKE